MRRHLLVSAMLVSVPVFADGMPPLPNVPVNVTNTKANPVPTAAQGVTQVSGAVDVTGSSVVVSNQPTVNLAPGSTVAVSGSVSVANQPTVGLATGSSVAVTSLPAVQISGTPAVQIAGAQFDSNGNLKVTGGSSGGAVPAGRSITLWDPNSVPYCIPGGGRFLNPDIPDTSDCRSLTAFVDVSFGIADDIRLYVPFGFGALQIKGTAIGFLDQPSTYRALVAVTFFVPGTSVPMTAPSASVVVNSAGAEYALFGLTLFCSR